MPAVSPPVLSLATWLILAAAGLLCSIWLWSCWCSFPGIPWNDIRVAPAVALHHGISIYTTAGAGPVSTWIYGPLPLLLLWPAGLATNPIGALEIAGAIHIGLKVMALAVTCLWWPAATGAVSPVRDRQLRLGAALLCVLLVRNETSGYIVYSADASGLVFGLLGLLALAHRQNWVAAACAAAAVACKQTMIGLGLAEVVWLYVTVSPREAVRQAGRCFAAGAALAIPAVVYFGAPGLWHTMVSLPGGFPWASLPDRLHLQATPLLIGVALPLVVMVVGWRHFLVRGSPLLLPALAFACTLPLSLAGLFRIGGNVNSLHSFWLWFPPTVIVLGTGRIAGRLGQWAALALAVVAAAVASQWLQVSSLRVRPNVQAYREAAYLAARLPEKIWFPLNPLITLYSDGRYYHDLDGLGERRLAGETVSAEHFFSFIPRHRQASATILPVGWGLSDPAEGRLPPDTPVGSFGLWRIDGDLR